MLDIYHAAIQTNSRSIKGIEEVHQRLHQLSEDAWLFHELAAEWRSATGHLSSPPHLLRYPAYHRLLAMKWGAVPFILGELSRDLAHGKDPWFWGPALAHLTGEEPAYEPGEEETVEGVAAAWLRLAAARGWKIHLTDSGGGLWREAAARRGGGWRGSGQRSRS